MTVHRGSLPTGDSFLRAAARPEQSSPNSGPFRFISGGASSTNSTRRESSAEPRTRPASLPSGPGQSVLARKLAVARGYERIIAGYTSAKADNQVLDAWVDQFGAMIPERGLLLDLGCGAARPHAVRLAERLHVTGIDLAATALDMARRTIRSGVFLRADLCELPFAPASFDAAMSLYAIIHVPRSGHPNALAGIARVLRTGAPVLLVMGYHSIDDQWRDFYGTPMHWSHYGAEVNRRLVDAAGFDVVQAEAAPDQYGGHHLFILARRR